VLPERASAGYGGGSICAAACGDGARRILSRAAWSFSTRRLYRKLEDLLLQVLHGASRARTGDLLGAIHSPSPANKASFPALLGRAPGVPQQFPQQSDSCSPLGQRLCRSSLDASTPRAPDVVHFCRPFSTKTTSIPGRPNRPRAAAEQLGARRGARDPLLPSRPVPRGPSFVARIVSSSACVERRRGTGSHVRGARPAPP
jgi:hypothetical protein